MGIQRSITMSTLTLALLLLFTVSTVYCATGKCKSTGATTNCEDTDHLCCLSFTYDKKEFWKVECVTGDPANPPESAQLKQVKEVKAKTTWKCYYKPKADATNDVVIEEDFTKKSWTWPSICTGGPVVTLEPDSSNNDNNNNVGGSCNASSMIFFISVVIALINMFY